MVKLKDKWPSDPDESVGVRVYVPAKIKHLYETKELRGKMSRDVRIALQARVQNNGYGFDAVRETFRRAQDNLVQAQAHFDIAKEQFFAFVAKEHEQQRKLLEVDRAESMVDETLTMVKERFDLWRKRQATVDSADRVRKRSDRKPALAWAQGEMAKLQVLKTRFTKPEDLLTFLEGT